MDGIIFIVIVLGGLLTFAQFLPKPKCPDCKIGKLHQKDVHNPDRWGNGTNIYKCDKCGKKWI